MIDFGDGIGFSYYGNVESCRIRLHDETAEIKGFDYVKKSIEIQYTYE